MFSPIIMERQDLHNISKSLIFQDSVVQCRSGPWFPTGVTSKQELLILPHHLSAPAVVSGVCVARSFVFCVVVCRSMFVRFLLSIVLSFLLRFTSSDYFLGIFKLFMFSFCVCCYSYNCCPHTIYTFFLCISRDARLFTCTSF
jgi:hypothetical protein